MLLTIAVPTWNRSKTLNNALWHLLPQISQYKSEIELIISDNASTDNTQDIIKKWVKEYNHLNIKTYQQNENLGFYGNFLTCRDLSSGQFFWLLSDDDFIQENTISTVIQTLKNYQDEIGFLFLENKKRQNTEIKEYSLIGMFHKYNRKLTFTSAVIFYNQKDNDHYLKTRFKNSNLFGFALLVDTIKYKEKGIVLEGRFLACGQDIPKGYNWFEAFVFNIQDIMEYMKEVGYPVRIIKRIENSLIKDSFIKRYFYLKAKKRLDGGLETFTLSEVNQLLYDKFKGNILYWIGLFPLRLMPPILARKTFPLIEKIRTQIKK